MLNQYEMEITCLCPVDDLPDVYHLTVTARRVIPVEEIIGAAGLAESSTAVASLCLSYIFKTSSASTQSEL